MKTFLSLLCLIIAIACCSCHKNYNIPTIPPAFDTNYILPQYAEALQKYDSTNYGVYKGVTINAQDSSATLKFNLYNNSHEPYVLIYANNKVRDSLIRYKTDATGYITYYHEKDTSLIPLNASSYYTYFSSYDVGIADVQFKVTGQGNSIMNVNYRGNQTLNAILKERSNSQVTCYQGSYSGGSDSGCISLVMSADSIIGLRASVWHPQFFKNMSAHYSGNTFTLVLSDDISGNSFTFKGTVQNNTCSGTWTKSSAPSVTNQFSAIRTL